MSRAPSGPPPMSREDVDIVVKRRSAPKGPPPRGMTSAFSAPKNYPSRAPRNSDAKYDDPNESLDGPYEQSFSDTSSRWNPTERNEGHNNQHVESNDRDNRSGYSRGDNYRTGNDQYRGPSRERYSNHDDSYRRDDQLHESSSNSFRRAPTDDHNSYSHEHHNRSSHDYHSDQQRRNQSRDLSDPRFV